MYYSSTESKKYKDCVVIILKKAVKSLNIILLLCIIPNNETEGRIIPFGCSSSPRTGIQYRAVLKLSKATYKCLCKNKLKHLKGQRAIPRKRTQNVYIK